MTVKVAKRLVDVDITLDNDALNEENYDDYYVTTKEGRGEDPTAKLIRKLSAHKNKNLKILFSGFKGCGKSTELLRLKQELDDDFVIHIFSVTEKLDPNNLTISEIVITVMKDLFSFVNENYKQIKLSGKLLKNLENWAASVYTEEINYKYYDGKIGAGGGINAGFGKILNVFAKLGLDFGAGRKFNEITKKEVKQTLSELILNCNLLIAEIKRQLDKIDKKNIIFIIEDLEKLNLEVAEGIFYDYPKQLTDISCCFIYTFPISLVYHHKYNIIKNEFDEVFILPMIKVHDKNGKEYGPGINSIEEIIYKRVFHELISRNLLKKFTKASGGCLRDLFRMLKLAAGNALDRDKKKIENVDFQYSFNNLKKDYYNTISYNEKNDMSAEDYYKILAKCCQSKDKRPMDEKGLMDLKHNMSILEYNEESWFDVHPAVKAILEEKRLI